MTINMPVFRNITKPANWRKLQMFNNLFEHMDSLLLDSWEHQAIGSLMPKIDIFETNDKYHIEVELPDIKREDIELEINNNNLSIKGKKEVVEEDKGKNYHCRERCYGTFQRSVSLPNNINTEKMEARLENGVLHVAIHKEEQSTTKKITIQA